MTCEIHGKITANIPIVRIGRTPIVVRQKTVAIYKYNKIFCSLIKLK